MTDHELEQFILNTLANAADWLTFAQLDEALYRADKTWRDEVRRSYLRGALGRMIADGRIERDRYLAKYRASAQQADLFNRKETDKP